jgi:UDP-glucuronate 4-epimerase
MRILLTGAAGFIGMHTAQKLLARGDEVVGIDIINDYYEVSLKEARLAQIADHPNFTFRKIDIADRAAMEALFAEVKPQRIVHLAAQAGVRYSLINPHAYVDANIQGFLNILEGCRNHAVEHLVYASSSSVYGGNTAMPFRESDNIDHPVSLYAATKKANELMAHTYSHLFRIPTTGLRFFTVYGPWGRPDMAPILFTKAMLENRAIDVFNHGEMLRDFTYIDDIVEGVVRVVDREATPDPDYDPAKPDPATGSAPYRVFNIGNNSPTRLMDFIGAIENSLGVEAKKNFLPMQPGDVVATAADTDALESWVGFRPSTDIHEGVSRFIDWYMDYYKVNRAADA